MTTKKHFLLYSLILLAAVLAATVLLYGRLPDRIPIHWNAAGDIDGYGPRGFIFVQAAILGGLTLLWAVLPALSPKAYDVERFDATYWYCGIVVSALLAYIHGVLLWAAVDEAADSSRAIQVGIGAGIVLLGNVIGKVRRNFWLGIRTPWTLASDRVWYATHRLGAKTMVAGGLVMLVSALAGLPFWIGITGLLAGALAPAAWSLVYYRRLERQT